jgi:hypothetical protein
MLCCQYSHAVLPCYLISGGWVRRGLVQLRGGAHRLRYPRSAPLACGALRLEAERPWLHVACACCRACVCKKYSARRTICCPKSSLVHTVHAYTVHAYTVHAYTVHAYTVHAYTVHAYTVHAYTVHAYPACRIDGHHQLHCIQQAATFSVRD